MTVDPNIAFQRFSATRGDQGRTPAARLAIMLAILLSVLGLGLSGSPMTVLAGGVAFAAAVFLLWRPDDLPILLMPAIYQWSQVAIKPILSIIYGEPIERVLNVGFHLDTGLDATAQFAFAGVVCLCLGMSIGAGRPRLPLARILPIEARNWRLGLVLRLSVATIVVGHLIGIFAGLAGGAIQLVLPFAAIEYAGLFMLSYWCFVNGTGYRYLVIVMAFEIIIGLTGFFADFRGPVLVVAIAVIAARPTFKPTSIAATASVAVIIVVVATFWSATKSDYRSFATGGAAMQGVVQPLDARLDYILESAYAFDGDKFDDGFNQLLARYSYIDFLGAVLSYVPKYSPHEDGALTAFAISNMLMPRVLFPNKAPIPSDTEITRRYTGMELGNTEATSISVGYLAELYVDFGYFGALLATLTIGVGTGYGYRVLRDYKGIPRLISYGITTMLAYQLAGFEIALTKYINGAVLAFGGAFVVQRIIAPKVLARYFAPAKQRPAPPRRG